MNTHFETRALRGRQTGATLIVGLVLLLVLTVLGVSGMNTATMQITMAGNVQFQEDAFQMAEDGIDVALAGKNFTTVNPTTVAWLNAGTPSDRQSVTTFMTATPVPDIAFSMGSSSGAVQAFHFDIISVGTSNPANSRGRATATHNQSFYVVGPSGP